MPGRYQIEWRVVDLWTGETVDKATGWPFRTLEKAKEAAEHDEYVLNNHDCDDPIVEDPEVCLCGTEEDWPHDGYVTYYPHD